MEVFAHFEIRLNKYHMIKFLLTYIINILPGIFQHISRIISHRDTQTPNPAWCKNVLDKFSEMSMQRNQLMKKKRDKDKVSFLVAFLL